MDSFPPFLNPHLFREGFQQQEPIVNRVWDARKQVDEGDAQMQVNATAKPRWKSSDLLQADGIAKGAE